MVHADAAGPGVLQGQRQFHVSAVHFLLEELAQLLLEELRSSRQPQVQIQEAMVHRLRGERVCGLTLLTLDLRKAGHRADRHD